MSRLFREQRAELPGLGPRWDVIALGTSTLRLLVGERGVIVFARFGGGTDLSVALLAQPDLSVLVNGVPIAGGLKILEHRDEIAVAGDRFLYSEESLPEITSFQAEPGARPLRCSLCRGSIEDGMTVVRCPRCLRLFHQSDAGPDAPERHCWTYSERCRHCGHPTGMTGESLWSPEKENDDA
jgi:hypothetical protein